MCQNVFYSSERYTFFEIKKKCGCNHKCAWFFVKNHKSVWRNYIGTSYKDLFPLVKKLWTSESDTLLRQQVGRAWRLEAKINQRLCVRGIFSLDNSCNDLNKQYSPSCRKLLIYLLQFLTVSYNCSFPTAEIFSCPQQPWVSCIRVEIFFSHPNAKSVIFYRNAQMCINKYIPWIWFY